MITRGLNQFSLLMRMSRLMARKKEKTTKTPDTQLREKDIRYNPWQAIRLAKAHVHASFDQTVELCVHLNVNPKVGDQIVRGTAVMPAGTGKSVVLAALCPPQYMQKAKLAGADIVNSEKIIAQIKAGKVTFDKLFTTPQLLPELKQYAKFLGPKGLMPNAKVGSLIIREKLQQAIKQAKEGQATFRVDSGKNIHVPIGKASFPQEKLLDNMQSLMKALSAKKPATSKGKYMKDAFLKTTMGPRWGINIQSIDPKSKQYLLNIR